MSIFWLSSESGTIRARILEHGSCLHLDKEAEHNHHNSVMNYILCLNNFTNLHLVFCWSSIS